MQAPTLSKCARLTFALMTLLLLGLPVPARPDDTSFWRATLKGITAFHVVVEVLTPEAERDGLTRDQLQTDVELRLRKAGINVTSSYANTRESFLYLNVNTYKEPVGLYAFNISLEFHQGVILTRNRNVSLPASTWYVGTVGIVSAERLREVRDTVADKVDQFINAYLEQNPKP
ncbi:MAG: hypothetical protein ACHQ7N_20150 [Candidatus Methylomirabilales bacterium]